MTPQQTTRIEKAQQHGDKREVVRHPRKVATRTNRYTVARALRTGNYETLEVL